MSDVMTWTVLQLMTDTAVLEQARDMIDLEEYRLDVAVDNWQMKALQDYRLATQQ